MPRIAGVDIPANKKVWVALTYIFGVGPYSARRICEAARIDAEERTHKLTDEEIGRITSVLDNDYMVEGDLRRQIKEDIDRLRSIRCYRGERHRRGLPVRGQRTRSNARTRKGRAKTVAGKKGVKEMR